MLVRNENGHAPQSEHNEVVPVSSQNTVGAAQVVSAGATDPSEVGIPETSRPTAVNEEPVAVPGVNGVRCSIRVEAGQQVTGDASAFASPTSIPTVAMNPASITNASASRSDQHSREPDLQPQCLARKIDDLLGKLTRENFEPISAQILAIANKSIKERDGRTMRLVIRQIFDQQENELCDAKIHAALCQKLWRDISPDVKDYDMVTLDGKPLSGGLLFRKYLLSRCETGFEMDRAQLVAAAMAMTLGGHLTRRERLKRTSNSPSNENTSIRSRSTENSSTWKSSRPK